MALTLDGSLYLAGTLPQPVRLAGEVIPGTVNLIPNPSFESVSVGTAGWIGEDGVTVSRLDSLGFHGEASLECAFPAGPGTPSVQGTTVSGLYFTGPRVMLGSIHVSGAFAGLFLSLVATYTDATSTTGEPVAISDADPDNWVRPRCAVDLDPLKVLSSLTLVVSRDEGEIGGTLWLDAAQVEEDTGWGVTEFATGQYGPPFHYWVGAAHQSASVRDDIPADTVQVGFDGHSRIRATMWRSNADNERLEDLSDHLISASVSADRSRATAWTMTCRMTEAGWRRLRPWHDWLSPVLSVTDTDGVTRSGQVGHYVVLPSAATHYEHMGEYDIDCRGVEYLLGIQSFNGKLTIEEGARLSRAVRWVLDSASLGEGRNGQPRARVPTSDKRARQGYEYTRQDSKLAIVNELLEAMVCQPIWSNRHGVLQSHRANPKRWENLQPVRLWAANFDPATRRDQREVERLVERLPASSHEVAGLVRRLPRLGRADNRIVVTSNDPRRPRVRGEARIDDPANPIGISWTRRQRTRNVRKRLLDNDATARQLARAIAADIGTKHDRVQINVMPDPETDLLDQVVYLAIYRLDGTPAAVGRYRVLGVEYGFTPENALMRLTLGFVHRVEELQGGVDLFYWDARSQTFVPDDGEAIILNMA